MSVSVCPAPTLSSNIGSKPAYSKTRILSRTEVATAPVAPRDARLRIKVPESVDSVIRALSPNIAPPVIELVGSTASIAGLFFFFFRCNTIESINELFPAPAGPVMPITVECFFESRFF